MRLHRAGTAPGPPPPCGMQKVLCRLRCDTSDPHAPGWPEADQCVHVGAVGTHLSAVPVHDFADFHHVFLEHAVGGGIGEHDRGEVVRVLFGLRADIGHVDVAVGVALGDNDAHAGHLRGCGVGAVGGLGDQADVAVCLAARGVVATDGEQARVLALRAGVGLEADRVVAGDVRLHRFQRIDQLAIALGLFGRRQRMDVREFRPRHRDHLGGGVELHGARAQRDHGAVNRQILVGKLAQARSISCSR